MRETEEKALLQVELVRDLCAEFEFKFPAHAVGRDENGISMLSERPPRETVEALWLPMVHNTNRKGGDAEYFEAEQDGTHFSAIYIRLLPQVLDGISVFGDSLSLWHMACENMLWTHCANFNGAAGVTSNVGVAFGKK